MTDGARRLASCATVAAWLAVGPPTSKALAQAPRAPGGSADTPLVSTYNEDMLRDLPISSLYGIAETLEPSAISDRFTGGGLSTGQPTRLGGFFGSWTQTLFQIDGVSITDPSGSGTPLLFPELAWWQRVRATTGMMPADANATGLAIDLQPRAPTERWVRMIDGSTSHFALAPTKPGAGLPALARLDGWDRATAMASGPLIGRRLGAVLGASWTHAAEFRRAELNPGDGHAGSVFSHFVLTPNGGDQIRTVGLLQRAKYPFDQRTLFSQPDAATTDTSGHLQAVWEHRHADRALWRAYASYSRRQRTPDYDARSGAVLERLVDGPVGQLAFVSRETVASWSLGASSGPLERTLAGGSHAITAGANATGGHSARSSFFSGTVGELVHGTPARLWLFQSPAARSARDDLVLAAWIADRVDISPHLRVEAGVRAESATGSADGAVQGVAWRSWLPRASARWRFFDRWQMAAFGGYARATDRLALDYLAFGDPGAPTADVYRWNSASGAPLSLAARGPLVARVGPGTGGSPTFSTVDTNLAAPTSDEFVVGFETHPRSNILVRVTGVARRVHNLLALTDVGAPTATAYSRFAVPDPGSDVLNPADDRLVPVYDRLSDSFGRDRYVLTNQTSEHATYEALEISLRFQTARFVLFGGGTAGIAEGPASSRGFGPIENDQTLVGELWSDPNAATLARGRLFTDRAFTGKLAALVRLPSDVRLGLIARYQDGQPFARMLVFPALNQGADAVRAFANGDSRFLFVGTLDARVQKRFALGARTFEAVFDAYNLLNLSKGVEEDVAAGPNVRTGTAVQPPRSLHIGVRLSF